MRPGLATAARAVLRGLALLLALAPVLARAQAPSSAWLDLRVEGAHIEGRWDIALRDLDHAIGLDDGDGALTWDEVRAHREAIEEYALGRLRLANATPGGGLPCTLRASGLDAGRHSDGAYAVLLLAGDCLGTITALDVEYRLLFDADPLHRGLLALRHEDALARAVFAPDSARQTLRITEPTPSTLFADHVRYGAAGASGGLAHWLLAGALLLPAGLARQRGAWQARAAFGGAARRSLVLLAALGGGGLLAAVLTWAGVPMPPPRWCGAALALCAALLALACLRPPGPAVRPLAALLAGALACAVFGGVLPQLGMSSAGLATALGATALGVLLVQAAQLALGTPLAWLARHALLRRGVLRAAALLLACAALAAAVAELLS